MMSIDVAASSNLRNQLSSNYMVIEIRYLQLSVSFLIFNLIFFYIVYKNSTVNSYYLILESSRRFGGSMIANKLREAC